MGSATVASLVSDKEILDTKEYWAALQTEEKLRVLCFKERSIVDRAHSIQQALYHNELMCYQKGIHFLNKAGKAVISMGLQMFRFRWPGGVEEGLGPPEALAATLEFVDGSEGMFNYIERQLGSLFAGGRPPLGSRENWSVVLEPAPHSWNEYERRVLRLVEWALLAGARQRKEQENNVGVLTSLSPDGNDQALIASK